MFNRKVAEGLSAIQKAALLALHSRGDEGLDLWTLQDRIDDRLHGVTLTDDEPKMLALHGDPLFEVVPMEGVSAKDDVAYLSPLGREVAAMIAASDGSEG